MKRLVLLLSVLASTTMFAQNEEVIMTIDGKPVYKSEFEYIFKKNNRQQTVTQKDLDEYMVELVFEDTFDDLELDEGEEDD
jgi:peptidyl-prolyl cis-trans isomerase SurA